MSKPGPAFGNGSKLKDASDDEDDFLLIFFAADFPKTTQHQKAEI